MSVVRTYVLGNSTHFVVVSCDYHDRLRRYTRRQQLADSIEQVEKATTPSTCAVNSFNEWDPLEEVIVGRLEGAIFPSSHVAVTATMPRAFYRTLKLAAGRKFPGPVRKLSQRELDIFIHVLEAEGVHVRRPDIVNCSKRHRTPHWSSRGFCAACPRDGLLVLGNEIIETPMAWRCRY